MKLKDWLSRPATSIFAGVILAVAIIAVDIYLSVKKLTTISEWWWKHGYKWADYIILIAPNTVIFIFCGLWPGVFWFGGMVCCHFGDKRVFGKN